MPHPAPPSGTSPLAAARRQRVRDNPQRASKPALGANSTRAATGVTSPQRELSPHIARAIVLATLLVSIGYAVAIGQRIQSSLGGPTETLYAAGTQQILITTFLRVALAAAACWLVALRPRAGYMLAALFGACTLALFAVGYVEPTDPGPRLAPTWLQVAGVLAAVAMTIASGYGLRRGT